MATTPLSYLNQYFTTFLNVGGGIDNSQTTGIVAQSVSGVDITKPGVACISYSNPIDTSVAEWFKYTSINGSNEFQGVTRGGEGFSAKSHSNQAVIAFPLSESHINGINEMFDSTGLDTAQIATPTSPSAGRNKLYFKSDDLPYTLTSGGVEYQIGSASSLSRQAIINGNFVINNRVYVSNATLAAGVYGHDRWKAGASGGDYTFTQLLSSTTITIKSGKSLIQVIDTQNVIGGTYTLSWTGTSQARFGIDSATPSGAYAASPITITTQTAGTVMSVEFNEGTIGKVQLNSGSVALPFAAKPARTELFDAGRYAIIVPAGPIFSRHVITANVIWFTIPLRQTLRVAPTLVNPTDGGAVTEGASNNLEIRQINNSAVTGFAFTLQYFGGDYAVIAATKTGHGLTDAVLVIGTKGILFNAEL